MLYIYLLYVLKQKATIKYFFPTRRTSQKLLWNAWQKRTFWTQPWGRRCWHVWDKKWTNAVTNAERKREIFLNKRGDKVNYRARHWDTAEPEMKLNCISVWWYQACSIHRCLQDVMYPNMWRCSSCKRVDLNLKRNDTVKHEINRLI